MALVQVLSSPCEDRDAGGCLRKTAEKPAGLDLYGKCQLELTGILPFFWFKKELLASRFGA